jgi:hypothetical protein
MKNEDMPDTIVTPDGETYWKMGWTGQALPGATIQASFLANAPMSIGFSLGMIAVAFML